MKQLQFCPFRLNRDHARHTSIKKAWIIIPDISGFTRLVHTSEFFKGKRITSQLLKSILSHNILGLKVSEIEGDAVLFYSFANPPSVNTILNQYKYMLEGFNKKVLELEREYNHQLNLSLKLIAHYGEVSEYKISGFKKLYGEPIIEAHRLLKNSINNDTYALLTDDLVNAAPFDFTQYLHTGLKMSKMCEVYGDLRNICFTYYDYDPVTMINSSLKVKTSLA